MGDRLPAQELPADAILYRRYLREPIGKPESNEISASVFPLNEDSCVYAGLCISPLDALYSDSLENAPYYYNDYGIVSFVRSVICRAYPMSDASDPRVFDVQVIHSPTPCMYPHCHVDIYVDGQAASPPKSIKSKIRVVLMDICERIKPAKTETT